LKNRADANEGSVLSDISNPGPVIVCAADINKTDAGGATALDYINSSSNNYKKTEIIKY
jgi:hypothetical protein